MTRKRFLFAGLLLLAFGATLYAQTINIEELSFRRDPERLRANWLLGKLFVFMPMNYHPFPVVPFGAGIRYERDINNLFSIGGAVYVGNDIAVLATARYFPGGFPFYLELGMGWGENSLFNQSGFMMNPALGARFRLGRRIGLFINPFVSIPVLIGEKESWWGYPPREEREMVSVSFRGGIGLGWAW